MEKGIVNYAQYCQQVKHDKDWGWASGLGTRQPFTEHVSFTILLSPLTPATPTCASATPFLQVCFPQVQLWKEQFEWSRGVKSLTEVNLRDSDKKGIKARAIVFDKFSCKREIAVMGGGVKTGLSEDKRNKNIFIRSWDIPSKEGNRWWGREYRFASIG